MRGVVKRFWHFSVSGILLGVVKRFWDDSVSGILLCIVGYDVDKS